jgi:hypothetical protein
MTSSNTAQNFQQKYGDKLFWMSVVADLIAIASFFIDIVIFIGGLFNKEDPNLPSVSPRVTFLDNFPRSDAIFLTGMIAISVIGITIYLSVAKSQSIGKRWPYFLSGGLSLFIAGGYFRLWLGEYWWTWILSSAILISVITTFAFFKIPTIPDTYRFGGIVATSLLAVITFFLVVMTNMIGDAGNIIAQTPDISRNVPILSQPHQSTDSTSTPTPMVAVDYSNQNSYIDPTLSYERWFPNLERFNNGDISEVPNSQVNDSSWGRITSYQRWYSSPNGCSANDLIGAYIQVIFFQKSDGAKNWFDEKNNNEDRFLDIGNKAYLYFYGGRSDDACSSVDKISINFLRNNVVVRTQFRFPVGEINRENMEAISSEIAQAVDRQLKSNGH